MRRLAAAAAFSCFASACKDAGSPQQPTQVTQPVTSPAAANVQLAPAPPLPPKPAFLPEVNAPPDNPTTPEKVHLGHMLFFDKRMSKDGSMGCAECHHIDKAYTDGRATSPKVGGAMNKRNSPAVVNLGLHTSYYWDGRKPTLESVSEAAWTKQLGADPKVVSD